MEFIKMHAAGNDYIYVDGDGNKNADFSAAAKKACDRRFGVGADGIIVVYDDDSRGGDFFMRIFNADGSEGLTCGNGLRCSAVFAKIIGKTDKTEMKIRTLSATHNVFFEKRGDKIISVADFPLPEFVTVGATTEKVLKSVFDDRATENSSESQNSSETENFYGADFSRETTHSENHRNYNNNHGNADGKPKEIVRVVNAGNLHAVFFDTKKPAGKISAELLSAGVFPDGINVESATVFGDAITCDVCERGSGTTYSCGSGAIATAFAAKRALGLTLGRYPVIMRGGTLFVEFGENVVRLGGEVTPVYRGEIFGDYYRNIDYCRNINDYRRDTDDYLKENHRRNTDNYHKTDDYRKGDHYNNMSDEARKK